MHIPVTQPRARALLRRLLASALDAVDPGDCVRRWVRRQGALLRVGSKCYDLRHHRRVVAVGAGKASARMAVALEERLGDRLEGGLVVVKYGHRASTKVTEILEAGHPIPDQAGLRAGARLLKLLNGLGPRDLVFVLLSGGASSLLPAPVPGVTLQDKQRTTQLLLRSGATIQDINTVRKHLSVLKGGRLAAATQATVISLILSDVLGDDPGVIGSGPTAPDSTTYADACESLRRYGVWNRIPTRVRQYLVEGQRGLHEESPKPGMPLFHRVQNQVIGNNAAAINAAAQAAKRLGLNALVLTTSLTGEAREAARLFGAIAREILSSGRPVRRPACILAGGELTVCVRGTGRGGRAQEFALAGAGEIAGLPGVWLIGFGTDGTDGPTDAAGAVVNGQTASEAIQQGADLRDALDRNDAYSFFQAVGGLIVTGPTGTNVNDLYLLVVE